MHTITQIVKDNTAEFQYLSDGSAIYAITVQQIKYLFEVPLTDVGTATLLRNDKAIFFMRWLRKAMDTNTLRIVSLSVA